MRFAPWLATATGATRLSRRVDAASSAFAVDGTSTTRPGLSGRILIPFGMTTNCASCGARLTTFCSRLKYESAPAPPICSFVAPFAGSSSSSAIRQRGRR